MADFDFTGMVDSKKLDMHGEDEILIGFPSGLTHAGTGEEIAEIAKKLTYGSGPQTWKTNSSREVGRTKTGKPKMKVVEMTHHVSGIPARPFLEEGISEGRKQISDRIEKYYQAKVDSKDGEMELNAIGAVAVGEVQSFVRSDYYKSTAPNSETTIMAKKSDTPLIDTGQMVNSITYVTR